MKDITELLRTTFQKLLQTPLQNVEQSSEVNPGDHALKALKGTLDQTIAELEISRAQRAEPVIAPSESSIGDDDPAGGDRSLAISASTTPPENGQNSAPSGVIAL